VLSSHFYFYSYFNIFLMYRCTSFIINIYNHICRKRLCDEGFFVCLVSTSANLWIDF